MSAVLPATQKRQRGFSLVAAIFLLVVLAALGAFIVTMSAVQHATASQSVQGARANNAARSGIEWGIYQVTTGGACPAATTAFPAFAVPGLNGFQVTVTCSAINTTESGQAFNIFNLTATAVFGTYGTQDFISRRMHVTVTNAP
jgi:MSHA biogenesis protein MshP